MIHAHVFLDGYEDDLSPTGWAVSISLVGSVLIAVSRCMVAFYELVANLGELWSCTRLRKAISVARELPN